MHVSVALAWMLSRCLIKMVSLARFSSVADFSQRWQGIRQGIRSRALRCSCMLWANGKGEFFRVENNFALWMNMICSHGQVERESFCVCSRKVMKDNYLLWYQVNLRVSQTMLNHNQNLFLIVCYCSVCLHWRVCKSVWVAHLHRARALSSPSRCFQLSTNFDKDFFRCLLCWDAATISSNAERLLT